MTEESEHNPEPLRRKSHRIQGPDSDDDDEDEQAESITAPNTAANAAAQPSETVGAPPVEDLKLHPTELEEEIAPAVPFVALPASAMDNVQVIDDPFLHSIAAQLKQLEDEVCVAEAAKRAEWKNVQGPITKKRIEELGNCIAALSVRLDKEKGEGEAHIEALECEIAETLEMQDAEKRKYNFPFSRTTFGQGGVYMAFDDCRIEDVSGRFEVELIPAMGADVGQISLQFRGKSDSDRGVTAKMRICDFKMKSDSMAVPSINLDDFSVEVTFTVTVVLSFSTTTKKWTAPADDFNINIVELDGPFVLNRGVVSAVMAVAVPIMKRDLLKELPPELGSFVSSIPLPSNISGTFSIDGDLPICSIFDSIFMSPDICGLTGYSSQLLLNFFGIQKSMERKEVLGSMMDLMRYQRKLEKCEQWPQIKSLWDEASLIYFSKTVRTDPAIAPSHSGLWGNAGPSLQDFTGFLAFDKLLLGSAKVRKNELNFRVDLRNIEGQIGIKNGITNLHAFLARTIESISSSSTDLSPTQTQLLADASELLSEITKHFDLILKHVDHIHNKVKVHVKTGPGATCDVLLKDFSAQAPIALWTALPEDHVVSLDHFIVPTLANIKTTKDGLISTRLFHMGCAEMLERPNFQRFFAEVDVADECDLSGDNSDRGTLLDSLAEVEKLGYINMGSELLSSSILQPQISLIVDKPLTLQPGAALFTMNVGPLNKTWTPPGGPIGDRSYMANIQPLDEECPLLVQTSSQVKLLVKSPEITVHIKLDNLVRYLEHHFKNVERLLDILSTVSSDQDINLKYINFSSLVVSFLTKYVGMPNLELCVDVSINLIANAGDVIVCIENHKQDSSAMRAHAKVNIGELVADSTGLKNAFLSCLN